MNLNALNFICNYCDLNVNPTGEIRYKGSGISAGKLSEIAQRICKFALPLLEEMKQEGSLDGIAALDRRAALNLEVELQANIEKIEGLQRSLSQMKDATYAQTSWFGAAMDHISSTPWTGVWHTGHIIEQLEEVKGFLNDTALPRIQQRLEQITRPEVLAAQVSKERRVQLLGTLARLMLSKRSYELEGVFRLQGNGEVIRKSMRDIYLAMIDGQQLSEEAIQKIVTSHRAFVDEYEVPVMFKQVVKSLASKDSRADMTSCDLLSTLLAPLDPKEIDLEWDSVTKLLNLVMTTPSSKLNAETLGIAFPAMTKIIREISRYTDHT